MTCGHVPVIIDGDRRLSHCLSFAAVVRKIVRRLEIASPTLSQWERRWSPSSTWNFVSTRKRQNTLHLTTIKKIAVILLFHSSTGILREWEHHYGYAHTAGGMKYRYGELEIPQTGLYYIYGQIYFQADDPKVRETSMVHFVYKKTKTHLSILLRSIMTKCQARQVEKALYSGYHGGVFRLEKGDKLMVGVPPFLVSLVATSETASFFGAFMI